METLDVVLCAEWMVTSLLFLLRFSGCCWEFHFLLFLLVFFDSAVYNLSGPLIMKAFGIFIFRIEKYLRHNGNLGRCPLCRKDSDIASVAVAFQWLLLGIPFPVVSASFL